MTGLRLHIDVETWPLTHAFVIARGAKTEAHVVVAHLSDGGVTGRGEAVPYARYGETVESVVAAIRAAGPIGSRADLARLMPPGAARNALDCALWDLEAKRAGTTAAALAGLRSPLVRRQTAYTLSLGTPDAMFRAAQAAARFGVIKIKLGGEGDDLRMREVRRALPEARLIADANEAWTADLLAPFLAVARETGIELVEQPLAAGADHALATIPRLVPICADESAHTADGLENLIGRYDAINIKLDKTGGLTHALRMKTAARAQGFKIMVGSMVSTSLAMAPAFLLAQDADWVDLDSPLLLARDREHGLAVDEHGWVSPPSPELWG